MVEWHGKSKRMKTGGKRATLRRCTKKNAWRGGEAANTKTVATEKETRNINSGRGLTTKVRLTATKIINLAQGNKVVKAEIIEVEENDANRLFARSNIATKGAKLKVKVGNEEKTAIVTNRPGQDGTINAKLA
jgi:small subunit ribosomal protein S8e